MKSTQHLADWTQDNCCHMREKLSIKSIVYIVAVYNKSETERESGALVQIQHTRELI